MRSFYFLRQQNLSYKFQNLQSDKDSKIFAMRIEEDNDY